MRIAPTILCVALSSAPGCSSHPMKVVPQPAPPPSYPARQEVPLDTAARESAKREILAASQSTDPFLRANAVEAAQQAFGGDAREYVLAGLRDPEAVVRFAAAMAAGSARIADAKPTLLELVNDKDVGVRVAVRYALHRLGDTRLSHDLEKFAGDPDPAVRGNAALALGLLGEPSALRVLKGMIKDRSPMVRFQVAEARWRLHDLEGAKDLVAGTVSGYPDDQIFCLLALAGPRDARVLQHVRGKLTSEYAEISLAAARATGMLGSDAGYGVARAGAKSSDPRQRVLAAVAFGDIGRADAQPILEKLLKDNEQSVRLAAATAVLELKSDASPVANIGR